MEEQHQTVGLFCGLRPSVYNQKAFAWMVYTNVRIVASSTEADQFTDD